MEAWWEIVSVYLLSSVKFIFGGVPMALGLGFSYFESIVVTSLGGLSGVTFFVFMSDKIIDYLHRRKIEKQIKNPNLTPKKKFTRTNRTIISVKRRFGLLGFSLMVPVLIPIPLGCFLAVRYFNNKQKVLRYLFGSILLWSVLGTVLYKPLFDAIRNYFL